MRSVVREWDLDYWLESLTTNAEVATVLGAIPASSDTVESERHQMNQCRIKYWKNENKEKKEEQKTKNADMSNIIVL